MSEYRTYYHTRQIIDVDTFLSERDEYYLMCVSKAQLHALRVMAKTRLKWPTSWAKERYDSTYLLPDEADWDLIDDHMSEWIQATEVIEVCNQNLIAALDNIATAVRLASCCAGAGPGGQIYDDNFYYGTEEPVDEPTAFGGSEEFATEESYLTHKCETANAIVNAVIGSLNSMSILTLASLVAGSAAVAIVGVGLLTIPPVAVLVALAATGLLFGALSSLANEIDDNREDLVCILFASDSAISAYDDFEEAIRTLAVDFGFAEIEVGALADVIMNLAPIDTMNQLFLNVGLPYVDGDEVDCDTCEACPPYTIIEGSLVSDGEGYVILSAAAGTGGSGDFWKASVVFNYDGASYCGDEVSISVSDASNYSPWKACGGSTKPITYYHQDSSISAEACTSPDGPETGSGVTIIGNRNPPSSTFTIRVDWSAV